MTSKIYLIAIPLSILAFALIPGGILTTFENVLVRQDGNSSNDTNMSSLKEDR